MPDPCIFCQIVARQSPATVVAEDDEFLAFPDIRPEAPTHLLVVPKRHIASLADGESADAALLGRWLAFSRRVAATAGLARGFRIRINTGPDGGQIVDHLHLHLMGGGTRG